MPVMKMPTGMSRPIAVMGTATKGVDGTAIATTDGTQNGVHGIVFAAAPQPLQSSWPEPAISAIMPDDKAIVAAIVLA
jgi:hypothetical protein